MIVLMAVVLISLPWSSDTSEPAPQPEEKRAFAVSPIAKAVRQFVRQGDAAIVGREDAIKERQALAQQIEASFAAEPAATWGKTDDAAELLRFVMFGGSAAVLRKAIEEGAFPKELERTAKGIVAYSERRLQVAREYLIEGEQENLPRIVQDPLALIKGTLLAKSDADAAITHFRKTELEARGTALEEAAIRQHVMTLLRHDRVKQALEKIKFYVRRYPKSVYWKRFRQVAVSSIAKSDSFDPADLAALESDGMSSSSINKLRELSVDIGKQLVLAGSFDTAQVVLAPLSGKLDRTSDLWRQAEIYRNLAGAVGADPGSALTALQALSLKSLPKEERTIVRAGIAIASDVKGGYRDAAASGRMGEVIKAPRQEQVDRIKPLPSELNDRVNAAMELAKKNLDEALQ